MSVTLHSVSRLNPNPSYGLKKATTPVALSNSSLRFDQLLGARGYGAPIAVPKGLGCGSLSLHRRSLWSRPIVAVAASQDESVKAGILVCPSSY